MHVNVYAVGFIVYIVYMQYYMHIQLQGPSRKGQFFLFMLPDSQKCSCVFFILHISVLYPTAPPLVFYVCQAVIQTCNNKNLFSSQATHEGKCPFMLAPCPACKQLIRVSDKEWHNERECPERKLNCRYCKLSFYFPDIKVQEALLQFFFTLYIS